ncbi:SusC/RagA family TonB-linked outer membrane protein [Bacteroides zoogleoformans]|uniref:SusC/RagA family TonB-linked outer membrane protein n=1 Tax=Bacteroides zoogleoformans TaxID=28119 RepID=UPI00248D8781|nr:SusC/RagA family TonB-linked outer membrane protein [Bacteroides zoogleoformans]
MKNFYCLKAFHKCFLFFLLFFFSGSIGSGSALAQSVSQKIDLVCHNELMPSVLKKLEQETKFKFLFTYNELQHFKVTVEIKSKTIDEVMNAILASYPLTYKINGIYVTVSALQKTKQRRIKGRVVDIDGIPLPGVNILTNDISVAGVSDGDGNFDILIPDSKEIKEVRFSYIGMKTVSIPFAEKLFFISMKDDTQLVDEVVVNGIFERKKESFTGATTVIRKEELMRNGSQNLLQNLKNIDPAFKIVENMDLGSNPNAMPEIRMRGQQSMPDLKGTYNGNPNLPLFILDGFESDITAVYDLDMNRVETIVLLKDAAAKAIYGSKAANGVVVIETRKPEAGKLRITYKGDLNLTIPDLTGYNLCNAREKFEVDKAHGVYSDPWFWEQYLNNIQSEIARGVDTDWLAQPLRTGVGHRHSVYLEGGDERLRYGVNLLYNDIKGIMKDSDRKTFTGGFILSYRYKNLLFRNQFNTTLNHADDSPYGSFSEYAELNPYWTPYDKNGNLKQIAGSTGGGGLVGVTKGNPLWNAAIGTRNFGKYTNLTNNFYIEWQLVESLKLTGRLGLSKTFNRREDFYPASHTSFLGYSEERSFDKGSYSKADGESSSISADLTANYSLFLNKNHLFFNAGWNMQQNQSETTKFKIIGFPNDRINFIASGLKPDPNQPFSGSESIGRSISLLSAMNYSYDDRYLADLSYRASASSLFGKENRWGHFWAVGAGWNLHKEPFMKEATWLKQFKVRASTGYTGAQNFSSYQALATFGYYQTQAYDNWIGSYLMTLPNDNLKWQKTQDYNVGVDINLFNRLNIRYDYYIQKTEDQLLSLTVPPSMGFLSYMENLGSTENKGMELKLNAHLLYNPAENRYLSAFFSIAKNSNKLKKISNALKNYNDEVDGKIVAGKTNKPQLHFIEGESMNAIWAVRSLGIDPATGDELYLTKDGKTTTEWRAENQIVCGDAMPKCTGTFGLNLDYKGIFMNMSFFYQLGGQMYNQTLVNRVENAYVGLNVDKRIYDAVWKQPGDIVDFSYSPYKTTKPSSRFIQDLNELRFSILNVGYDFRHTAFLNRLKLAQLKISFYMNDIFRASTVKVERGLDYPFARTYSISLQATF